jgi:PIN domain nuclease of toxin-antitoxin system
MNYIVDTHTLIWYLDENTSLSPKALKILENFENQIFISQATMIELSIKISLQKLSLPISLNDLYFYLERAGWTILPLSAYDIVKLSTLQFHHGDPFDRMIACQCLNHNFPIISKDQILDKYNVTRIWN